MIYFSHEEVQKLSESIALLYAEPDSASLPERTVSAVKNLIAAEMTAFDSFSADQAGVSWISPNDALQPRDLEIFAHFMNEHPLFEPVLIDKRTDALKVTDFVSNLDFKNTGLYNEFYRRIGINSTMLVALPVSPELLMTSSFYRKGRDFSERDSLMLSFLAPHLTNAVRTAQAFQKIESRVAFLAAALLRISRALIIIDENGKIVFQTVNSVSLLEKYFADFNKDELPAALSGYVQQNANLKNDDELFFPPAPFRIQSVYGELIVSLAINSKERRLSLLLEERKKISPAELLPLGLTRRETEILFWMMQDKTNEEIGTLCGISPLTVKKHAENIYAKLNVRSRTAAVSKALEIL